MRNISLILAPAVAAVLWASPAAQAATPAVQITRIHYDSPGSDRGGNKSVNGEYIVILNTTRKPIGLEGWTIRDKTGFVYEFGPDVVLGGKKKLVLRSGQGDDGASTVYWGRRWYVWNNDKDTAYLRRADGRLVDKCAYDSSRHDHTNCQER
ncbi:lamin tail domain-containing protein [Thermoactinospora rubra]|uniref:lamin tail domain-containing protein n=1 Tax=Thermoactinospora rubra TaxID=1088767 RepID=UPI000A0F42B7|nr:lamin tail domain-containing protein [Thermoactinospora rubra]